MSKFTRRDFLKGTAGARCGRRWARRHAAVAGRVRAGASGRPEKGAKLRVLRWKRFVQGDEDMWMANTKKFTEKTGVEVRVDSENWEDMRPKAAVAANVGSGPDIIISTFEDAHQYPDKLVDVTDVANYLGGKYGGWYDVLQGLLHARRASGSRCRWAAPATAIVHRIERDEGGRLRASSRRTLAGFLKLAQAMKAKGTPPGFALGNATGDANVWCHWLVWSHGGKMVDEKSNVVISSPETVAALELRQAALRDLRARHAVVARSEQQQGLPRRRDRHDRRTASRSTTRPRTRRIRR